MAAEHPPPPSPSLRPDDLLLGGLLRLGHIPPELRSRIVPELFEHARRPVARALLAVADRHGSCRPPMLAEELTREGAGIERTLALYELEQVGAPPEDLERYLRLLQERLKGPAPFGDPLPDQGWIRDYVAFGEEATDAPRNYHLACGLFVIGALLGNRVYLPRGASRLFPSLYICLLGRSRWDRKSTCVGLAESILTAAAPEVLGPHDLTPEALYEHLSQHPATAFLWREFTAVLDATERTYMAGFRSALTDFYDSRGLWRRMLKAKPFEIRWPALSVLTASVPILLFAAMREREILGGFYPRFLYVFPDPKPRSDPNPPAIAEDRILRLADTLKPLTEIKGEVSLGAAAAAHADFYRRTEREAQDHTGADLLAAFYGTADATCLKVAMDYHFAESDNLTLTERAMLHAIASCEAQKARLRQAVETELALSEEERHMQRILQVLDKRSPRTRGELLRYAHLTRRTIEDPLQTLIEAGRVIQEAHRGKHPEGKLYWHATHCPEGPQP